LPAPQAVNRHVATLLAMTKMGGLAMTLFPVIADCRVAALLAMTRGSSSPAQRGNPGASGAMDWH